METSRGNPPGARSQSAADSLALAALILGIIGLVFSWFPLLGVPLLLVGLITGIFGLKSASRGRAIAGVILSGVGLALSVSVVALFVVHIRMARLEVGVKARESKIRADMSSIHATAEILYTMNGEWPESIEDLVSPRDPSHAVLESLPKDPWGNDYHYDVDASGPVITCLGRDGVPGGEGEDRDVQYPPVAF